MRSINRISLIVVILVLCIGCDQITKEVAKNYLNRSQSISYFGDIFRLQYEENTGAFLSLGSALSVSHRFWILIILAGFAIAAMLVFILSHRKLHSPLVTGFSLIIGGGVSNLMDRMFNKGAVVDFMNIGIGGLRTGIFNVADIAIMAGTGLLILFVYRHEKMVEKTF